jgi:hypothetical protein
MMTMMTSLELNKLAQRLDVPFYCQSLLSKAKHLSTEETNFFRSKLAELSSDEALLSVACMMRELADHLPNQQAIASMLILRADYVLDDYAPLWMQYQAKGLRFDFSDWAVHMEEDLEALTESLKITRDALWQADPVLIQICDILIDCADDHIYRLSLVAHNYADSFVKIKAEQNTGANNGANIIAFPLERVRKSI